MVKLESGQRVGDYRLERCVGAGAFAEVWLAVEIGELGFRKRVALKVLKELDDASPERFETLVNEARLCGHLHHPHIVDVYGVGEHEGMWFIAMEFVQGGTLAELGESARESGFRLPRSVVLDVGIQIANALDYAHNAQDHGGRPLHVIHRDLKPANVLMNEDAGVKVADFGIARAVTNVSVTQSGVAKGTPCYLAPEGWEGGRSVGPPVDIFALGAVLAELATGSRLYSGGSVPAIVFQILQGSAAQDVAKVAPVFPELAPLLERMLKRRPQERMGRASEVAQELRRIRARIDAPGDLSMFLKLVGSAAKPRSLRADGSLHLDLPVTDEPGWSEVLALARGEGSSMDGGGAGLEGDPGATRRVAPQIMEAFLAGAGPGSTTSAKPRAAASAPADLPDTYTASPESLARIKSDVADMAAAAPQDTLASAALPSPGPAAQSTGDRPRPVAASPVAAVADQDIVFESTPPPDPGREETRVLPPRRRRVTPDPPAARRSLPWLPIAGVALLLLVGLLYGASNRSGAVEVPGGAAPPEDLIIALPGDVELAGAAAPAGPGAATTDPPRAEGVKRGPDPTPSDQPRPEPTSAAPVRSVSSAPSAPEATPAAASLVASPAESSVEPAAAAPASASAASAQGCIALRSDLGGGLVWINGTLNRRLRTSRVDPPIVSFDAGRVSIGMARQGRSEPTHRMDVEVRAGWHHVLSCELGSDQACSLSGGPGSCP